MIASISRFISLFPSYLFRTANVRLKSNKNKNLMNFPHVSSATCYPSGPKTISHHIVACNERQINSPHCQKQLPRIFIFFLLFSLAHSRFERYGTTAREPCNTRKVCVVIQCNIQTALAEYISHMRYSRSGTSLFAISCYHRIFHTPNPPKSSDVLTLPLASFESLHAFNWSKECENQSFIFFVPNHRERGRETEREWKRAHPIENSFLFSSSRSYFVHIKYGQCNRL